METYIALLRGINVSGKNSIKMEVLKQICTDIGLQNVQTYIQSGNIIFQSEEQNAEVISLQISQAIQKQLALTVPVLTLELNNFKSIVLNNPFTKEEELKQLYITLYSPILSLTAVENINAKKAPEELLHISDSAIYLVANNGYGKTKITNTLIENKLKVTATTRNYRTCLKLIELIEPRISDKHINEK